MTAYVSDYTGLITSEHSDKPKFSAMVQAMAQCWVDYQNAMQSLVDAMNLDTAVGDQLDILGRWIGITRNINVPIDDLYFAYDDVDGIGLDLGIWKTPSDPTTGVTQMDDTTYRAILRAKVGANHWDGSIEGLEPILSAIFSPGGTTAKIVDNGDMTYNVNLTGTEPTKLLMTLVDAGYIQCVPAGMAVTYTYTA
ncbi:DUF2612 domain-containing protein [Frateuria aurantia]|uniref:Bacteriophage protein n=1 Tax=Frateuria aurantia (strain ATCC 33424 / DSM 6220 / KCTC 2777 / LMG 1558 / NBRC 3245 / NCIMB 13370) TaxID=767434 RepID=H8L684_FRAAD|nr:DUF2612 domain-containing protein [Frateuria aurantia]AFC85928.1 Protein of unknown function (DUF2612) [Frateuria aurantia DSM 6220]